MTVRSILPLGSGRTGLGMIALLALASCQDGHSPTEPLADAPSLALAVASLSTGMEIPITTNESTQWTPAISGDRIVWQDFRSGNGEIYLYDLSESTEIRISTGDAGAGSPAISGDRIVWQDYRDYYTGDIYLYDLSTSSERRITTQSDAKRYDPAVSGDRILWREWSPTTSKNSLYVYDLLQEEVILTITDPANPQGSAISGDLVVWEENADIYMYDLSADPETQPTQITSDAAHQYNPAISGDRIVWWGDREGSDIYLYDLSTGTEIRITTDDGVPVQRAPAISGDRIVWADGRNEIDENGNLDIYMYDLSTGTETQITTNTSLQAAPDVSGDRIVWEDGRNGNDDIYMYTFVSSPEAMLESLITEAAATEGVSRGTLKKLYDALKHLEAGRTTPAVGTLQEFIEDVQDQIGKKITAEDAEPLIAAAETIVQTILASL